VVCAEKGAALDGLPLSLADSQAVTLSHLGFPAPHNS